MEQSYKVARINAYIKSIFNRDALLSNLWVEGEVSNCKYHPSGHIYFTLKDEEAQLACVMFATVVRTGLGFRLREGMSVRVKGYISVYDRDGKYQLYASKIEQDGIGRLYEQYEALKRRLAQEGLFAPEHKKLIPQFPKKVGIVTARSGAALQDICNVLHRRNPYVQPILVPAKVQGEGAAESVSKGIRRLEAYGVDVIIVGRGGGSIEDLWAFNEEIVARTVYACSVPVISCVGHETDTTIIDYVADLRAPTPSAAAELAVREAAAIDGLLVDYHTELVSGVLCGIERYRKEVAVYQQHLQYNSPKHRLDRRREYLVHMEDVLRQRMSAMVERRKHRLEMLATRLHGLSPLTKIGKGYGFLTDDTGMPIQSVSAAEIGSRIEVHLPDGRLETEVKEIWKYGRKGTDEGREP